MWLDPSHPDPHARNLRDEWLPALEWYYSERVRQLSCTALSDEALLEAADFGVFIE